MHSDTVELYPTEKHVSTRANEYELEGSTGRQRSRFSLLHKIVAFIGLVVLALCIATIVMHLEQEAERRIDLTVQTERKSQSFKVLARLEHQIKKLQNESADQNAQLKKSAGLSQTLAIMRTTLDKVKNRTAGIQQERSQMSEALAEMRAKLNKVKANDYCPLKYNGTCTWLELRSSGITFEQAQTICVEQGGQPANIYSRDHYYIMIGYTTVFAFRKGWMEAWLGMTYDTQNKTALLSDGTVAPYVKWHPAYPKLSKCCKMGLNADADQDDDRQDMFTMNATTLLRGVLCEK